MTAVGWVLFFQIVCFLALVLLMHRMYQQLRSERSPRASEPPGLRSGVTDLVAELRATATEINADMSARAATLQKLVDEANDAMRRLDAAAARAASRKPARPVEARPRDVASASVRRPTARSEAAPIEVPTPAGRGRSSGAASAPAPVAADAAPTIQLPRITATTATATSAYRAATQARAEVPPPPVAAPAASFVEIDPADTAKFQVVRRLASQGMSAAEIAREAQLGREEVDLIMRLSVDDR